MDRFDKRRRYFDKEQLPKIQGKVSRRIELHIARCYLYGYLTSPLESITDAEFLAIRDLGSWTLAEIRKVIPAPEKPAYPYKPAEEHRVCRVCGCTDENACVVEGGEGEDIISTCCWVKADLCSACSKGGQG